VTFAFCIWGFWSLDPCYPSQEECQHASGDCGRNKKSWEAEDKLWANVKDSGFSVDLTKQDALAGRWARALKKDCWPSKISWESEFRLTL
jgi:hypothetical protein